MSNGFGHMRVGGCWGPRGRGRGGRGGGFLSLLAAWERDAVRYQRSISRVRVSRVRVKPAPRPRRSLRQRLESLVRTANLIARTVLWVMIVFLSTIIGVVLHTILSY